MSNYKTFEDFLFVEVPNGAHSFKVSEINNWVNWLSEPDEHGLCEISDLFTIPKGNWEILGVSDEITEQKAHFMCESFMRYFPESHMVYRDYTEPIEQPIWGFKKREQRWSVPYGKPIESYKSLLVAAGIDYKRFLILKLVKKIIP